MFQPIENKTENINSIWLVLPKTGIKDFGPGFERISFTGFIAKIIVKTEINEK